MPNLLISYLEMQDSQSEHVKRIREAGFELIVPENPDFCKGLCDEQETIRALNNVSAVIAWGEHYSANVLRSLPDLRVVARAGVGFDRVAVPVASECGIAVTITPNANHQAVAEHALALMFSAAKQIIRADRAMHQGHWPRVNMKPLRDRTLGIVGLGRIGKSLATRASALNMHLVATEPQPDLEFVKQWNIELLDLESLVRRSDYVSLHVPLSEDTHGLLRKDLFSKMKPGSVLINTSRGGLIVEKDLVDALQQGPLEMAALDVFEEEPTDPDNPILKMENAILTPHVAGDDGLSVQQMAMEATECILELQQNRWPRYAAVNQDLEDRWQW